MMPLLVQLQMLMDRMSATYDQYDAADPSIAVMYSKLRIFSFLLYEKIVIKRCKTAKWTFQRSSFSYGGISTGY